LFDSRILLNFAARTKEERKRPMARPIRETPVLKGEDAFNFEWRRLTVENRTPEEKAEARRKFEEEVAEAKKHLNIKWCW